MKLVPTRLHHYWRSSSSWRVRWALELKNIPVELVTVNLLDDTTDSPAFRAINPAGYVPALELKGPNGSSLLTESLAIIEYLDEYAPHPPLLPSEPLARAQVRALAETINSGTQPLQNPSVVERLTELPEKRLEWNQHWISRGLEAYSKLRKLWGYETARYSCGDTLTLSDLCLIPQVYNAHRFEIDVAGRFPDLERIYLAARALPECQKTSPEALQPPSQ